MAGCDGVFNHHATSVSIDEGRGRFLLIGEQERRLFMAEISMADLPDRVIVGLELDLLFVDQVVSCHLRPTLFNASPALGRQGIQVLQHVLGTASG